MDVTFIDNHLNYLARQRNRKHLVDLFSADDLRYAKRATYVLGSGLRNHAERQKDLSKGERDVLDKILQLLHGDPSLLSPTSSFLAKDESEVLSVVNNLFLAFNDSQCEQQSAWVA